MQFDSTFAPCKTSRVSLTLLTSGAIIALAALMLAQHLGNLDQLLIAGAGVLLIVGLAGMFYSVGRGYEKMVRKFKREIENEFGLRLTQSQACQFLGDNDHDSWLISHKVGNTRQDSYLSRLRDGSWTLTAR